MEDDVVQPPFEQFDQCLKLKHFITQQGVAGNGVRYYKNYEWLLEHNVILFCSRYQREEWTLIGIILHCGILWR